MTTAIATDRLKQLFAKWDTDGNGTLERSDFEQEADHIAQAFGKDVGSPEAAVMKGAQLGIFTYLATSADVGTDGSLTEDQFMSTAGKLLQQGEGGFDNLLRPLVQALVVLCDDNADGRINPAEFSKWLGAVGVDGTDTLAADTFKELDTDGDGQLTVDELLAAVRGFHFGTLDVSLLG